MLILLAKEVVENQSITNLEWVKIGIEGLVTLITVFIGAFLAYIFSRKSDKKSITDEREVQYIVEFQKDLILFVREYTTFAPILIRTLEVVKSKAYNYSEMENTLADTLHDQRKILYKLKDLSTRSKSLENITGVKNVISKFKLFHKTMNNELESTMVALEDAKMVVNGKRSTKDYKVNYDILDFDYIPYESLMVEMQNFIFKK